MGITQKIGAEHNVYWNLGNLIGNKFEDAIFSILLSEYREFLGKNVFIEQTERRSDYGKDIIIKFSSDFLSLFNVRFSRNDKKSALIYIECKSSNSTHALRREKFKTSIERASRDEIDYYVLLTNSKILAIDYYEEEQLLNSMHIKFVLIDQYLLAKFLNDKNYTILGETPLYRGKVGFYGEYQVYSNKSNLNQYDIYFNFRNYNQYARMFTIRLLTDVNWDTDDRSFSFVLDANLACSKKISLLYDLGTDYAPPTFKVEAHKFETFISIKGIGLEENYIPEFIGKRHRKIVSKIETNIKCPNANKIFCLWGDAGIGKTRIVHELSKRISQQQFDICECPLKKNNDKTIKDIQKFLFNKKYITEKTNTSKIADLYDVILDCKHIVKSAIIFIDDVHNGSPELIKQLKKIFQSSYCAPVIFILCGRTDYTAGNTEYYSFVQWTFEHLKMNTCVWNVKPLRQTETKEMIRTMIDDIPEEALNTICSRSQNNPLYIIQFIEYLLDERIAYVVNRNTVGIIDPGNFQFHNYLPYKIADIYQKRIEYLINVGEKEKLDYLKFLFVLAIFNGQISTYTAEVYFDRSGLVTSFLCEKRFISKQNNNYIFHHESLMLYIQKILLNSDEYKEATANYFLTLPEEAMLTLPTYTQGRLYGWSNDLEKALDIFEPMIMSLKETNNFSNTNIDLQFYEYLDDVLSLIKDNSEYYEIARIIINSKIYITLHHFIPMNAIVQCNQCLEEILKSPSLKQDKKLINSILAQKAHSLLNTGKNLEGELILKELQVKWLICKADFDIKTTFDMLDRLCAIYIKFNCYALAYDYNKLELNIAKANEDDSLSIIAYRTRSKLFYLNDPDECRISLDTVDKLLEQSPSNRIKVNNNIYRNIFNLSNAISDDYDEIIYEIETLAEISVKQELNRASIQSNMVLAAAYLKRGTKSDLRSAKQRAHTAINYSIRFGIPSYMWQLYNLLAIIDTRLGASTNKIKQHFETTFDILHKQGLLYIGRDKLCYSNILAISNIGIFLSRHSFQKTFNARMSLVAYHKDKMTNESTRIQNKSRRLSKSDLSILYEKANNQELLFCSRDTTKLLRDNETNYYIALT